MSDIEIRYNDKRVPISGTGPTPFLSLNSEVISYGNRWGTANRITLNGQITGTDYDALYYAQTGLVDIFSSSYKTLKVLEGPDDSPPTSEAFLFSGCSIDNISFGQGGYNKIVDYTVEMLSFPSGLTGYFSGVFGVIDPKDEIRITEDEEGFGTIVHSVEARGFVTTSIDNAINNARNYVASRTGISNIITTPIISGIPFSGSVSTPVLVNLSENLDRLNLTYSIDETYKFKLFTGDTEARNGFNLNNWFLASYSTSLTSGAGDDYVIATIKGDISAGLTGDNESTITTNLVRELGNIDTYKIISGKFGAPNNIAFCRDPIEFTVEEDLKQRVISFSVSYDNLEFYNISNSKFVFSGCYLDATISHSIDELTEIDSIQIKGDIKCRGSVSHRYNNSLLYLTQLMTAGSSATLPRLYDVVNDYYTGYYGVTPEFSLNTNPSNIQVDANPLLGTISINASYNNKDAFLGLTNTDYSIEYTPYNTVFAYGLSCNDSLKHLAVDINTKKRERINLDLTISKPGVSEATLLGNKDSIYASFLSNFIAPSISPLLNDPINLDTLQTENSSISLSNSSSAGVVGTVVSATKTYSYELSDAQLANRIIIKS
jgi:hypothetical protein